MGIRTLQTIYVVTIWSGGKPGRRWKTLKSPRLLPNGTGVTFRSLETKMKVHVIGNISVEEYEEGREYPGVDLELEGADMDDGGEDPPEDPKSKELML
ncbi:MAG: hypothetical protein QG656_33 [Candidatus Hydrogenedentes bacterium]|nr:hypothetical protein [Candidatus Hydrogenedentota bacterium]